MDLSKAYDCLPQDLLVAKFEAYGIDKTGLNLGKFRLWLEYNNNQMWTTIILKFAAPVVFKIGSSKVYR